MFPKEHFRTARRTVLKTAGVLAGGFGVGLPASTGLAAAATRSVPSDYPTIQDAIDAADPGDVIDVAAGTYGTRKEGLEGTRRITVDKRLTIRGAGSGTDPDSNTIIEKGDPHVTVKTSGEDPSTRLVLKGFRVRDASIYGINLDGGGSHTTFEDVAVVDCGKAGVRNTAETLEDVEFVGCEFSGNEFNAIDGDGFRGIVFENCTFEGNGRSGLASWSGVTGLEIRGGSFRGHDNPYSRFGVGIRFGPLEPDMPTIIRDTTFAGNNGGMALEAAADTEVAVEGVTFTDNTGVALSVGGESDAVTVEDCEFSTNGVGVVLRGGLTDPAVTTSRFEANEVGVRVDDEQGADPTGVDVGPNTYVDNTDYDVENLTAETVDATCSFWGNPNGWGFDDNFGDVLVRPWSVADVTTVTDPRNVCTGGGGDVDVLNVALSLEHLTFAFYRDGLERFDEEDFRDSNTLKRFSSRVRRDVRSALLDVRDHERTHVERLTSLVTELGGEPTIEGCYDFRVDDVDDFLVRAAELENMAVSIYDGAVGRFERTALAATVGTIATVEARHASYLDLLTGTHPFPGAFDTARATEEGLDATDGFAVDCEPFRVEVDCTAANPARITVTNVSDRTVELRDVDSWGVDAVGGRPVLDPGESYSRSYVRNGTAVLVAYRPRSNERISDEVEIEIHCG